MIEGFAQETPPSTATFRDPAGSLCIRGDEVLRTVDARYAAGCLQFLQSDLARRWTAKGNLIATEVLSVEENGPLLLRHPRVFFPSYPWEWTAGQWMAAAELTLELCGQLLEEGWILKDATPLNILFEGHQPVFVDVLSVERRDPGSPLWLAYGQFARTFLLPLAANKYLGWPLWATMHRRDGYEPADLYPYLRSWERWRPPLLALVTLPHLLEKKGNTGSGPKLMQEPAIAAEVLAGNVRRCGKVLRRLAPRQRHSRWSRYPAAADHYSEQEQRSKKEFVVRALELLRPSTVLDIGGNTGEYSQIAARAGAAVVAWDTDHASSELNWRDARAAGLPILPLVADVARPTPAAGWCNRESLPLLERAHDRFDCVMMLGILHHLLLHDQIPVDHVAALLASLTRRALIVEWVPATDVRFLKLCRGREQLYQHLAEDFFLQQFGLLFTIHTREELGNGRVLFLLEKK